MFINKYNGRNNIVGLALKKLRKEMNVSQRVIAEIFQENGIDVDKNAIQRMESGQRFITDIELVGIMKVFDVSFNQLMKFSEE
jgi:transcriptional regulator with XRE-family HTH domain